MPSKRKKDKSKSNRTGGGGSDDVTDSNTGDCLSVVSNNSEDTESVISNCSHRTADDVLFRQTPDIILQLNLSLEQLGEKCSKSRPQSRITALQTILKSLQSTYYEHLIEEWDSGVNALVDVLARLVRSGVKEEISVLALYCLCTLSVQVNDINRVTHWLIDNGWQEVLLNIIQMKGASGGSVANSPAVRSAALHTLATLHFMSDYENHADLLKCMEVMESIYYASPSAKKLSPQQHMIRIVPELQCSALDNWCLLFTFLPVNLAHSEGQKQIGILYSLLCSDANGLVKMSAGQALALICERLRMNGHSATALLAISVDDRYDQLLSQLKALAQISEKCISKELRKGMRTCFRLVRQSIERDLGRRDRTATLTMEDFPNALLPTGSSEEDNEFHSSEEDDDENLDDDEDDAMSYLNSRASSRTASSALKVSDRWSDAQYGELNMGSVKLPLTREVVWLRNWSHKRYYDSLSLTLRGGLQSHLQLNSLVRQVFDLSDRPRGLLPSASVAQLTNESGHPKDSKMQRRQQLEHGKKQSKQERQKLRHVREQRLGQRPSMSED